MTYRLSWKCYQAPVEQGTNRRRFDATPPWTYGLRCWIGCWDLSLWLTGMLT